MIGFLQTGYMSLAAAHRNARDRGVGWWCFRTSDLAPRMKVGKKKQGMGGVMIVEMVSQIRVIPIYCPITKL